MCGVEIGNGTAVGNHHILEAPFVAQYLLQQTVAAATWVVVPTLVGTHHLAHVTLLHQCLERRHVCFPQVTRRNIGEVGYVTAPLGTAVHCIVLGTCQEFKIPWGRTTATKQRSALKSGDNRESHTTGQIRVFAVCLLSPAPSRVAEDVHVRRPHRQAVELLVLATVEHALVILCTHLGAGGIEDII